MSPNKLPVIDVRYWVAILAASMCGANNGNFASRILGPSHAPYCFRWQSFFSGSSGWKDKDRASSRGSFLLRATLVGVWLVSEELGGMAEPWYWLTIVATQTAGPRLVIFSRANVALD